MIDAALREVLGGRVAALLSRQERLEVVRALDARGIFNVKRAMGQVADALERVARHRLLVPADGPLRRCKFEVGRRRGPSRDPFRSSGRTGDEPSWPPREPILELRGLRKTFPGVVALDGVDFDVRRGEVHALLGANGAGKSTLIKIVAGLYRADEGEIRIGGRPVELRDTQTARALGVSVIYQDFALAPNLSVAENLFFGRELTTPLGLIDWRRTYAEAHRLLDRLGIDIPTSAKVSSAEYRHNANWLKLLRRLASKRSCSSWMSRPLRLAAAKQKSCSG